MDMDEVSAGGLCTRVGAKCGRWNPTAEQVKVLTDLFSSGLRTPTTEQIQKISSHLSSFGKIESKNVFYWFQNHKARERHHKKRRRGKDCITTGGEQEVILERREREIETLELFPLSPYELEREKVRAARNEWMEIPFLDAGRNPPLDLRLSFL